MSIFLNREFNNNKFELMNQDEYFVDKTRMISQFSDIAGKMDRYICITYSSA